MMGNWFETWDGVQINLGAAVSVAPRKDGNGEIVVFGGKTIIISKGDYEIIHELIREEIRESLGYRERLKDKMKPPAQDGEK